jgi:hypothetical protein
LGTSNFHRVNARNVYAVLMDYEQPVLDDDGEETDELEMRSVDDFEIDDFKENIIQHLKEKAEKEKYSWCLGCKNDPHELRSFGSIKLIRISKSKIFADIDVNVEINCVMRSAYYEGACLDWYITEEDSYEEYISNTSDLPIGMQKIILKHINNWITKTTEELIVFVEEIYREESTPLQVAAKFSNGETMYSKI